MSTRCLDALVQNLVDDLDVRSLAETPPQKHRTNNRAGRVGKPSGSPKETTKNQEIDENPKKLRHLARS